MDWLHWISLLTCVLAILMMFASQLTLKNTARFRYYNNSMRAISIVGSIGLILNLWALWLDQNTFLVPHIIAFMISAFIGLLAWPYKTGR